MLFTKTTFTRRTKQMARKGEGIGIVEGWQGGLGGEMFERYQRSEKALVLAMLQM